MYSANSSDINFPENDSQLLFESPPSHQSSNTGPGGDDLSISELSLSDRTFQRPFSLLAHPAQEPFTLSHNGSIALHDEVGGEGEGQDDSEHAADAEKNKRLAAKLREEKLQSDVFILKKLNASFALFNETLGDTESANECLAAQLEQTDALLTKYVNILSKSEQFSRMILDEKWQGAEDDEEVLESEQKEAENKARREAEARAIAAQQAQERREREEKERVEREERERVEKERKERTVTRGGVRGVRGTRASMRGARGSARAGATPTTGSSSSNTSQIGSGSKRSTSSTQPTRLPSRAARGT